MKTTMVKNEEVTRTWFLVDAAGKPAGRLAVRIADILRGKTKPSYTPHVDMGDFVVVVNAAQVKLTGTKEEKKLYKNFSGYPGGLKYYTASTIRAKNPTRIMEQAVRGMLPKNKLSRHLATRLKIYPGAEHPHAAQKPHALEI